ncbi:hypothetical protein BDW59DRAFT_145119 [Aspergillus cavernicola]|uniref:Uncharacterized protein n=1 Tax=Aspergillus cavernicola TaxID=176166 RepID=A0ABR4IF73_9EURO
MASPLSSHSSGSDIGFFDYDSDGAVSPLPVSLLSTIQQQSAPQQPSVTQEDSTITAQAVFTSSPIELPPQARTLLEEWHRKNGPVVPPCGRSTFRPPSHCSKAYDRQGKEVEVTTFKVTRPCAYGVHVVWSRDDFCKLVTSIFGGNRRFGVFYKAWLGTDKGYDPDGCVVRHFGETPDMVNYQEGAWKYLEDTLKSPQDGTSAGPATVSRPRKRTATLGSSSHQRNKRRQSRKTQDTSSDDASSAGEEENEVKAERTPITRISKGSNGTAKSQPFKYQVIFKLVGFNINARGDCEVPLEDCSSNAQLFAIAQSFYRVFDRNIKVQTLLSCQITSQEERRYLFEGAEGAFQLLVERAKQVASNLGRPATIEVQFVQS